MRVGPTTASVPSTLSPEPVRGRHHRDVRDGGELALRADEDLHLLRGEDAVEHPQDPVLLGERPEERARLLHVGELRGVEEALLAVGEDPLDPGPGGEGLLGEDERLLEEVGERALVGAHVREDPLAQVGRRSGTAPCAWWIFSFR